MGLRTLPKMSFVFYFTAGMAGEIWRRVEHEFSWLVLRNKRMNTAIGPHERKPPVGWFLSGSFQFSFPTSSSCKFLCSDGAKRRCKGRWIPWFAPSFVLRKTWPSHFGTDTAIFLLLIWVFSLRLGAREPEGKYHTVGAPMFFCTLWV